MYKRLSTGVVIAATIALIGSPIALARDTSNDTSVSRDNRTVAAQSSDLNEDAPPAKLDQERQRNRQELQDAAADKREQVRESICEARKTRIEARLSRLESNAKLHLDNLNAKLTRLDNFVKDNSLTVENYDSLKADIIAKQQAALSARAAIAVTAQGFDCTSSDRKAKSAAIREKVTAFQTAAAYYRAALKKLYEAVKAELDKTDTTDGGSN